MIKLALETAYKVFFNHYVKLNKSNAGAKTMATVNLSALILLAILNIFALILILGGNNLIPSSKPNIWLFTAIYFVLAYQFTSRVMRVNKPLGDSFNEITASNVRIVWSIYGILLMSFFIQALLKKF